MRSTRNLLLTLAAALALDAAGCGTLAQAAPVVSAAQERPAISPSDTFALERSDSSLGGGSGTAPANPHLSNPIRPSEPTPSAAGTDASSSPVSNGPSPFLTDTTFFEDTAAGDATRAADDAGEASDGKRIKLAGGSALDVPRINQIKGGGKYPRAYCGPTSVRMVLAYFGTKIGADTAASGVYIRGKGASHEGMARKLRQYGVKATLTRTRNLTHLKAAIGRGHPVIINVRGNYGPRSTGGHIIVVVGFDGSGNPIINDPAGGGRHVCPKRKFVNAWNGLMIEASK
jgi:uncharacterized protein YvpB